jgi:CheY-like chemotaxis protein
MNERVLWFDNDAAYVEPYREELDKKGIFCKVVTTITEAEQELGEDPKYDVLILDVMIPTKSEAEEQLYPPQATNSGLKTGLVFYERLKERLKQRGTQVIVMTARLDKGIQEEFVRAGLSERFYCTKMSLREAPIFIAKIREVLEASSQ